MQQLERKGTTIVNGMNESLSLLKALKYKYQQTFQIHFHFLLSHTYLEYTTNFTFSTMAGVNPEADVWKPYHPVMDTASGSNVDGKSDNMKGHNNLSDDGSVMHFSVTRPALKSIQNAVMPSATHFTILYKGNMCIYDGIPAEKVHEIMLIAAASAKSFEMKSGIPFPSLISTCPTSPQGNSNALASPQSVCFPAEKSSICRLQEFPLARRQSLQRFLEKRRKRLGSKAPYATSATKVVDNIPDFGSFDYERRDFSPVLLPLEGN
ncbi:hypothetical protein VNO77_05510 [Canavalia gladiata]|uniref:Protein TIFY n=1 Tax=Canavalia gladiata TaxID=3824 RepID=A0AAN9N466_CANGL